MTRPFYETPKDQQNEKVAATAIAKAFRSSLIKLPRAYPLDWMLMRSGEPVAMLEIKCRNRRYPEMFLSLHKWMFGYQMATTTTVGFVIAYSFPDGIGWVHSGALGPPVVGFGGRTDRNDDQDMEPTVMIPIGSLNFLK